MLSDARSRITWAGLLVAAWVVLSTGIAAATTVVTIASTASTGSNSVTGGNAAVTPSPVWAPAPTGAEWISDYADAGCNYSGPFTGVCLAGPHNPVGVSGPLTMSNVTVTFYQTFTIGAPSAGPLDVWADDTATVFLDPGTITSGTGDGVTGGQMLAVGVPTVGNNCASAAISCVAGLDGSYYVTLDAGTYTLVVDAYQLVGGTPFAVMYSGAFTDPIPQTATPEPGTYMLLGLGLAGLGGIARRRKVS